jgi:hypothetical protein
MMVEHGSGVAEAAGLADQVEALPLLTTTEG